MYLGIDIGGTFTDLVLMDEGGNISTAKAPTTPGELEKGVFDAVAVAAKAHGLGPEELLSQVTAFGHGTTQATNALIERTGATTGLITTRGFGDTLALQRLMGFTAGIPVEHLGRYSRRRYPDPIVPRRLVREVRERVDQAGRVLVPLDEDSVRSAVRELLEAHVQTCAVVLLWSFRNPAHEERVGAIIREMAPDAFVSLSCQVSPIIGEYERTATTVLNSYLAPKVANYLDRIESLLRDRGFSGKFNVLNSAGGVVPAREAARKPILLVASGPAGGVMGSLQLAQEIGHHNIITTDMGGTSFDVALVVDGKPLVSGTHEVGGYHLNTPVIDIRAIGAGGGSIARVQAGLLRVGPDSAGAMPGPACYGRGGKLATVTDADLVLGILDPDNFLGGRMKLDFQGATAAIREQVAEPLGMSVEAAAARCAKSRSGAATIRAISCCSPPAAPVQPIVSAMAPSLACRAFSFRPPAWRTRPTGRWPPIFSNRPSGLSCCAPAAARAIPGKGSTTRASIRCLPSWNSAVSRPWSNRDFRARNRSSPARSICATGGRRTI